MILFHKKKKKNVLKQEKHWKKEKGKLGFAIIQIDFKVDMSSKRKSGHMKKKKTLTIR